MDPLHEDDFFKPPYFENRRDFKALIHSPEWEVLQAHCQEDLDRRLVACEEETRLKLAQLQVAEVQAPPV